MRALALIVDFGIFLVLLFCDCNASDISDSAFAKNLNDAIPAAYGDFNSDELTDVFVLRDNFRTIEILLASEVEPLLRGGNLRCHFPNMKITSVVPGDFDGDAFMDVMFTVKMREDDESNQEIGIFINWGGSDYINCTKNDSDPIIRMIGEPLALDFNDDMIIDLFGMDEKNPRVIWAFKEDRTAPAYITLRRSEPPTEIPKLRIPHSHAVVDLNNDFLPDLYVTTERDIEIWYAWPNNKNRYEFNRTIQFKPDGSSNLYGQSLFLDLELDGNLNQLMPVCQDTECRNCTIWVHSLEHQHDLNINFFQDDNKTQWGFMPPHVKEASYLLFSKDHHEFFRRSITLRGGDFNNDGYPDLLVTLQKTDGSGGIQTFLMENIKNPNARETDRFKRTFVVRWNALAPFGDSVMGSFYDFYQDGILDVILLQRNGEQFKPLAFRNTLDYDANFVKVIVMTGLTNKHPRAKGAPFGSKRRNDGTNLPGPRIEYHTTTQDGLPQHGGSTQLPQSAYFSLHLPYTIFGLGRTPNFVDEVQTGLAGHHRTWLQVIPNSQIFVIPAPPNDPNSWKAQLFVTPSKIIIKSVFALLGICLLILIIILGLHIKERREDKLEKLQEAQRFHFDAM